MLIKPSWFFLMMEGVEIKGTNKFQDDQLLKIFDVLGPLTADRWPNVFQTPESARLKALLYGFLFLISNETTGKNQFNLLL
jgi:hypothetical protein